MTDRLLFRIYGEMYLVDLASVLYFKADDHYTHVYSTSGTHMVMPFGLSKVEAAIAQHTSGNTSLLRLGRTYIVDVKRIYHVNMLKQTILLADDMARHTRCAFPDKYCSRSWNAWNATATPRFPAHSDISRQQFPPNTPMKTHEKNALVHE